MHSHRLCTTITHSLASLGCHIRNNQKVIGLRVCPIQVNGRCSIAVVAEKSSETGYDHSNATHYVTEDLIPTYMVCSN